MNEERRPETERPSPTDDERSGGTRNGERPAAPSAAEQAEENQERALETGEENPT